MPSITCGAVSVTRICCPKWWMLSQMECFYRKPIEAGVTIAIPTFKVATLPDEETWDVVRLHGILMLASTSEARRTACGKLRNVAAEAR